MIGIMVLKYALLNSHHSVISIMGRFRVDVRQKKGLESGDGVNDTFLGRIDKPCILHQTETKFKP